MKTYWVTDMNSEETYEGDIEQLTIDISQAFQVSEAEAAETLRELDENESIQFNLRGVLYELDVEVNE